VWTCEECNLNFTSSQALGGHKATSLEHRQRQDSKKEKETKPSQLGDDVLVDGPLTEVWGGGCSLMTDSHENADADRPMRRKRMLADDSRFALQLHHEELKATRVQKVAVHGAAKAEGTAGKKVKKGMVGEVGVEVGRRTWGGETTAMKKTSKTDWTESDSEVEDLSRDVGSITNNTAVSVQEQCGKKCKTEIRKIRVFPAGGSEQKKKYSVSKAKFAGGERTACDDCRKKRIRCVHMAAAHTALGVPNKNTKKHAKEKTAGCGGSTIERPIRQQVSAGGNGNADIRKSALKTAQVEIQEKVESRFHLHNP
jgi:hypothetical protein